MPLLAGAEHGSQQSASYGPFQGSATYIEGVQVLHEYDSKQAASMDKKGMVEDVKR